MKKVLFCIIALSLYLTGQAFSTIDPNLQTELARRSDNEKIKVNILLSEQAEQLDLLRGADFFATKEERRQFVVETLQRHAKVSQAELLALLEEMERNGMVEDIRPLWIANSISCYANKLAINNLSQRRDVMTVYYLEEAKWIFDEEMSSTSRGDGREIAENLLQVNAPQVWEQGYTGQGVLIGVIDTGVRLDHADLAGRLWDGGTAFPNHGYDFYYNDNDPSDDLGHGSHVAGTICGTGASGSQTGIAPGATVMALKTFNSEGVADETH